MTHRDVCFLSLLALTYLYLDTYAPRDEAEEGGAGADTGPAQAVRPSEPSPDRCPRSPEHTVHLRGDGAKWCRGCDQAFFPTLPEWASDRVAAA